MLRNRRDEHEAFADSRSSNFIYVPFHSDAFPTIDNHVDSCDEEAAKPLVVAGETGADNQDTITFITVD